MEKISLPEISLNRYEIDALLMIAKLKPLVPGAWFNAAVEYLSNQGYCTRILNITPKGQALIDSLVFQKTGEL